MNQSMPFNVLIVEDEIRHRRIYGEALEEQLPVKVKFVGSADDAILALKADVLPALVILDIELKSSGHSGRDLLVTARSDTRLQNIPIVILTGVSGYEVQSDLLNLGADDFIEKGSTPQVFVARIRAQLRHSLATQRLERTAIERDLFAAGVLHDIALVKNRIVNLCGEARSLVQQNPVDVASKFKNILESLTVQGTRLGSYATDVIQNLKDGTQEPKIVAQDLEEIIQWTKEIIENDERTKGQKVNWKYMSPIKPVLADKSFLKMVFLNMSRIFTENSRPEAVIELEIKQFSQNIMTDLGPESHLITTVSDAYADLDLNAVISTSSDSKIELGTQQSVDIGLVLAAKVMKRMQGRLWVDKPSNQPKGVNINLQLKSPD